MLSLKYIRKNLDYVQNSLIQKNSNVNLSNLLQSDDQRRNCLKEVEKLRAERNKVSVAIAQLKKEGRDAQDDILAMRNVSDRIKDIEVELKNNEKNIAQDIFRLILLPDILALRDESQILSNYGLSFRACLPINVREHPEKVESLIL